MLRESRVGLPDGRSLTVYEAGEPDGRPILFHHGTPGSGNAIEALDTLAAEQGIRLIAYDRSGYGASDPHPGRSVGDVAADVAAAFDVERFATWGHSGGGPHALACAAILPHRVVAAASVAGVAPWGAKGLDWLAGMGEANVEEFGKALQGEAVVRPALEEEAAGFAAVRAKQVVEAMATLLPPADVAALEEGLAEVVAAGFRKALERGIEGWLADDLAFASSWGFDPMTIEVPVLVVQGRQDLMVPGAHGDWLAARIPGAEARISENDGHITLFAEASVRAIHGWLLAHF